MKVDKVNFNEDAVRKLSKEEFIAMHIDVFWQDRDEATRRKMLADAYDRMTGEKTKRQKNAN